MRTNRTIKQIQFWVEDSRAYLWVPALICLALSFLIWNSWALPKTLALKIKLEKPGVVQVFIDDGSGYTEEHSIKVSVRDNQVGKVHLLRFVLTDYPEIVSIRIDPTNNDGALQISKIEFKNTGRWMSESVLKPEYQYFNQIRFDWKANKSRLDIYPDQGANDPCFILDNQDFNSVDRFHLAGKQVGFHFLVLLVSAFVALLTARFWIQSLVYIINFGRLLFVSIRWVIEQYTFQVDRFSMKWHLVNPTSCAVAGLAIAALATYLNLDSPLFKDRHERRGSEVIFTVTGGSAHSVHVFYRTREGYSKDRSRFLHFDPDKLPFEVGVPLPEVHDEIVRIRIDPFEHEGDVTLANLRIVNYAGTEIPIDMSGWSPSKTAEVVDSGDDFMRIVASGDDPFVVSPELAIDLRPPFSIPVYVAFPVVLWFFSTLAFLIYNRMVTEGMSMQKIRMLQR